MKMANIICSILGHKPILKDWYPMDRITTLVCIRCKKTLKSRINYTEEELINQNRYKILDDVLNEVTECCRL
jgi:hypothetical protein